MGSWGGKRPGAGRKPNPNRGRTVPVTKLDQTKPSLAVPATVPAEPKSSTIDPRVWGDVLRSVEEISRRYARNKARTPEMNPFRFPVFPKEARPPEKSGMAMDEDKSLKLAMDDAFNSWGDGAIFGSLPAEGLLFLGYTYLAELAQRPEYRLISETIADDATRMWIDFDVTGDEQKQREEQEKDPQGFAERMADPDERKKRLDQAGKLDKVKELQDDQERLQVRQRFYEQCRNDGFFGRTHLYLDIRTDAAWPEVPEEELKADIGDGRSALSISKCPRGAFAGLRTIEPVWTYPLQYNANNPLREDWYNPQIWYVMGKQIHGSRIPCMIGHPVPDILKPAYAFGGLSLSQMAKPYVDIWLQTRQSVADLIKSFSVMVLMTDLSTMLQPGDAGALMARVAMFNIFRDNQGTFVVNKNSEEFKNVSASLASLDKLQAQAQEHMASVSRIPLVKFTGISPTGLNATSEFEIEVYDDTISAYQKRMMDVTLRKVIAFEHLHLWGKVDPEITHRWNQLRDLTSAEKGQKQKDDAERDQKYVDMGAVSPAEVRKRIINDKDLPYTALDPDDVPPPPAEEGLLGPGAGGAAKAFEEGGGQGGEEKSGDKDSDPSE